MTDQQETYEAIGKAVEDRIDVMGKAKKDIAKAAGMSPATLREIMRGTVRDRPGTWARLSNALGWPDGALRDVLAGNRSVEWFLELLDRLNRGDLAPTGPEAVHWGRIALSTQSQDWMSSLSADDQQHLRDLLWEVDAWLIDCIDDQWSEMTDSVRRHLRQWQPHAGLSAGLLSFLEERRSEVSPDVADHVMKRRSMVDGEHDFAAKSGNISENLGDLSQSSGTHQGGTPAEDEPDF